MKPKHLKFFMAVTALMFGAQVQADNLDPADYDVFYTLTGFGADNSTHIPLTADLGIVIVGGVATLTLHNTSDDAALLSESGNGVGDAPRIDELFFNLFGDTTGLTAAIVSITDGATTYDCDDADSAAGQCDWALNDPVSGNSGGGGTFNLSYECLNGQECDLGVPETLVFTLDMDADINADTFLMAAGSTGGNGGHQACASFQDVGDGGEDSGVACGAGGGGTTEMPEPGTLGLLSLGLIGAGLIRRRRVTAEQS